MCSFAKQCDPSARRVLPHSRESLILLVVPHAAHTLAGVMFEHTVKDISTLCPRSTAFSDRRSFVAIVKKMVKDVIPPFQKSLFIWIYKSFLVN